MARPLHRSRNGMLFGVCQGIADYFDISAVWIRLVFAISFAFTLFFPTGLIYLVLAIIMKKAPGKEETVQYHPSSYQPRANARTIHLRQLKDRFHTLENRIRRMENHVTDKAYDWEQRLNSKQ